jgi:hypothetical protein
MGQQETSAPVQCGGPSNFGIELRSLTHRRFERTNICPRGTNSFRWRSAPKAHVVGFWLIASRSRIDRRLAARTESLQTDVSTIGGLSIFRRFARQKHERAWMSDDDRSQWSAAHGLAVGAVASARSGNSLFIHPCLRNSRETIMKIDGRCHCGYVTFEAEADPETTTIYSPLRVLAACFHTARGPGAAVRPHAPNRCVRR